MSTWLPRQLSYGGDYNPEQWPREVWLQDVKLMLEAKVNLVTLGVFSWANIEVADGDYRFEWLDEVIELLHANGIGVDLATATASPPAWLTRQHPEVLPVNYSGTRLAHGGRQGYCVSSPIYKAKSVQLASKLAERYATHPAIKMWHINNEYGCHNALCFCDVSAEAWRKWLKDKYQNLESLNSAWGTNFWSQKYHDWHEIGTPSQTPDATYPNPTMFLDFRRFSNSEILELYKAERDAVKAFDTKNPVTTNFMSMKHSSNLDYWQWAEEVDFVATDHYLIAEDPENYIDLAFQADVTRGFAGGKPWLLMEHSTSAVNWQERNLAKAPGEMIANSISHVARGSNGAMFFQWRQSISGSEKFHSAMVPHAGKESRLWSSVVDLGQKLEDLAEIVNTPTKPAELAMIFDYDSWWALSQRNLPTTSISYPELAHDWYRALWKLGIRVDFIPPSCNPDQLKKYKAVLAPMLYLISDQQEQNLLDYAKSGRTLITSYFAGISNKYDQVKLGGYGGKLTTELFELYVEEFAPAKAGEIIQLSSGLSATEWAQRAVYQGQAEIDRFDSGQVKGEPAIVRASKGNGWYVGTRLTDESCIKFFNSVIGELKVPRAGGDSIEVVERGGLIFEIDHKTNQVTWS